jgi:hypothetical protein
MEICPPALVYIFFTISQIIIDIYQKKIDEPFLKTIVGLIVTGLLVLLCKKGFSNVAWIIVLVPFLLMVIVSGILIFVIGYDPSTGEVSNKHENINVYCKNNITVDNEGNIMIYNPNYDATRNPVYFRSPYIIVPNVKSRKSIYERSETPPFYSSSPEL